MQEGDNFGWLHGSYSTRVGVICIGEGSKTQTHRFPSPPHQVHRRQELSISYPPILKEPLSSFFLHLSENTAFVEFKYSPSVCIPYTNSTISLGSEAWKQKSSGKGALLPSRYPPGLLGGNQHSLTPHRQGRGIKKFSASHLHQWR